jgi:DNA mismatch endonuclease (patch repair protein)
MADNLSPEDRSKHMARIRGRDTRPELQVRGLLHSAGYRYRVQLKGVPGRPDIAFPARKKAVFVHGCFWHGHEGCKLAHTPRTRPDYWAAKFERNKARDQRQRLQAAELGWEVLVVWECEVTSKGALRDRLTAFLGPPKRS